MFLLGYIAAPPTVTVCSANAGDAIMGAPASPAATAVSIASFVKFMTSSIFDSASRDGIARPDTERSDVRMTGWNHRFVIFPLAITGPVGCPVGEPPGGSSETASVASAVTTL